MSSLPLVGDVIVIGAGPAGLAVGACLKQAMIPCIVLEQDETVGSAWHRHYDRLHLHTDKRNSALPFLPLPKDYPRYPSRAQVIDYLESYTQAFGLDIRFHQRVISARYENRQWEVQTRDHQYHAPNLVVAAGYNCEPYLPTWPGQDGFRGAILHSSQYRNGERFRGQRVLVVGFGNSGGEIAIDLWEHGARVSLSVRSAVNVIPRELLGIPILSISILLSKLPTRLADAIDAPILRLAIGDLTKYGLRKSSYGPLTQIQRHGRVPLIDVGTVRLIKNGQITVYEGIQAFTEDGVVFSNDKQVPFDAVILATGYHPKIDAFLSVTSSRVYDEKGTPLTSGRETGMTGLYFCGYYVAPTGMLREIAIEAKRIAAAIARQKR